MAVLHKLIGKLMTVDEAVENSMSASGMGALVILLLISLLPVFVREFRNSARLTLTYWFVVALHQSVAFTDAFLFKTIGYSSDAEKFNNAAITYAQNQNFFTCVGCGQYKSFFENMLGFLYWIFGSSILIGSQLSILMFAISCLVLVKIMGLLELSHNKVPTLFVFGSLPSMVFFGSVPLRESSEVLFFMLVTYFGLRMLSEKNIRVYGVFMVVSALVMGQFHAGLMIIGILISALFFVWNPHPTSGFLSMKKRHLKIFFVMLVLLTGIIYLTRVQNLDLGVLSSVVNLDILNSAMEYQHRTGGTVGRSTYSIPLDFSSFFTTVHTSFLLYLHYLFGPFPWQVNNIRDVAGSMESILRMVLLYFSVMHWYHAYGVQRRLLMLMLLLFFGMSFMWALGTTNYGTAMRHNLLSWWILVITGVPLLTKALSRLWLNLKVLIRTPNSKIS